MSEQHDWPASGIIYTICLITCNRPRQEDQKSSTACIVWLICASPSYGRASRLLQQSGGPPSRCNHLRIGEGRLIGSQLATGAGPRYWVSFPCFLNGADRGLARQPGLPGRFRRRWSSPAEAGQETLLPGLSRACLDICTSVQAASRSGKCMGLQHPRQTGCDWHHPKYHVQRESGATDSPGADVWSPLICLSCQKIWK